MGGRSVKVLGELSIIQCRTYRELALKSWQPCQDHYALSRDVIYGGSMSNIICVRTCSSERDEHEHIQPFLNIMSAVLCRAKRSKYSLTKGVEKLRCTRPRYRLSKSPWLSHNSFSAFPRSICWVC